MSIIFMASMWREIRMTDIKNFGLNTICPVCGEEMKMIDIHINSLDGVQRITGRCVDCGSYFEVVNVDGMEIENKWNRIFEKEEGVND
jgi:C4-type Zn-finger protein